jgi:hypothetical protein
MLRRARSANEEAAGVSFIMGISIIRWRDHRYLPAILNSNLMLSYLKNIFSYGFFKNFPIKKA